MVFFKHKYLTNPDVTPEDKVIAAAQILTQTMKVNLTGKCKEMEALENVADIFETVAKIKAQEQKQKHNEEHAIILPRGVDAQSPRVDAHSPRVEE